MVNFNGDLLPSSSHFINHENRGLRHGDALFEDIRVVGNLVLFWEAHYFRLMASLRQLRMEIPMSFTLEFLQEEIKKTLAASGLSGKAAAIRIIIFRKGGGGYLPDTLEVSYIIEANPLEIKHFVLNEGPYVTDIFRDYQLPGNGLSNLNTVNKVAHVLGSIFARENDLNSCLLLNHRKEMAEGIEGNLFVRKGGKIKTPPLGSGCSDGILRKHLLKQDWSESPFALTEEVVSPFELQQADELFLTDSIRGILSITQYRKASYTREAAIFFTAHLNSLIQAGI